MVAVGLQPDYKVGFIIRKGGAPGKRNPAPGATELFETAVL